MNITRIGTAKALAVLAAAGLAVAITPASVQAQVAISVDGVATCDPFTGDQVVTWTFDNNSGQTVTIDSADVDESGLSTGSTIDLTATMSPTSVPSGSSSTGSSRATGDATGDYNIFIHYTDGDFKTQVNGEVVLPGGCVQTETSTTEGPTTTAAPATTTTGATGAVAVTPTYPG